MSREQQSVAMFEAYLRHMAVSRSISVSMCSWSSPGLSSTWQMGQIGAWLSYRDIFFLPGQRTRAKTKGGTSACVQHMWRVWKINYPNCFDKYMCPTVCLSYCTQSHPSVLQGHTGKLQHCVFLQAPRFEPLESHTLSARALQYFYTHTHTRTHTQGNRVLYSLHCVLSGQSRFKEVSAMDEIMLYRVCQHYLTSLSLISRAQGGAHLFVCVC